MYNLSVVYIHIRIDRLEINHAIQLNRSIKQRGLYAYHIKIHIDI